MLLRDAYYALKPAIPRDVRVTLRRLHADRVRRRSKDWPISEASSKPPEGWPGWPFGKTFTFVLTHDVEGQTGLERCSHVAAMEVRHGFRSSFNFVPEGEYDTPARLREFLRELGFEVGVHDLHHDGRLYRSRDAFRDSARRINSYLESWEAVGFRSAFMLHNLKWLRDLDVLYDASTFDTDPFEPQPDGMNTIFPFWVPRDSSTGYVELPYTLVQDSTLFNVLQESDISVWTEKLDWVAAHGGLALVNVHPDYMNFGGVRGTTEFPARFYEELLEYVKARYADQCWFALPREVAEYVSRFKPAAPAHVRSGM